MAFRMPSQNGDECCEEAVFLHLQLFFDRRFRTDFAKSQTDTWQRDYRKS